MQYDADFAERIKCSDRDLEDCAQQAFEIIQLAERAQRDGLLALENDVAAIQDPFLSTAFQLVVDGVDQDLIARILEIRVAAEGRRGAELLRQCLTLEGALAVQRGDRPEIVEQLLGGFLGEHAAGLSNRLERSRERAFEELVHELSGKPAAFSASQPFDEAVMALDDRLLQQTLRAADQETVAMALKGAAGNTVLAVLRNMTERAARLLKEDIDLMDPQPEREVVAAQRAMLAVAQGSDAQ